MNDILFCHKPTDTPAFLTDEPLELPQRRHPRQRNPRTGNRPHRQRTDLGNHLSRRRPPGTRHPRRTAPPPQNPKTP
ncbi:hypothetical protein ABIT13_18215 [Limnospira fusiformis NRMCF6962]